MVKHCIEDDFKTFLDTAQITAAPGGGPVRWAHHKYYSPMLPKPTGKRKDAGLIFNHHNALHPKVRAWWPVCACVVVGVRAWWSVWCACMVAVCACVVVGVHMCVYVCVYACMMHKYGGEKLRKPHHLEHSRTLLESRLWRLLLLTRARPFSFWCRALLGGVDMHGGLDVLDVRWCA